MGFSETGKSDPLNERDKSLKDELKKHKGHIWTDSMWTTYQESIDFEIPNPTNPGSPIRISRKISKGMSVKTDAKTPARIMNAALKVTLNPMLEEDKEEWLNTQRMKRELVNTGKALSRMLNDMADKIESEITEEKDERRPEEQIEECKADAGDNGTGNPEDDKNGCLF